MEGKLCRWENFWSFVQLFAIHVWKMGLQFYLTRKRLENAILLIKFADDTRFRLNSILIV